MNLESVFAAVLNAVMVGFGTAVGAYIANRHFLVGLAKAKKRLKNDG